VIARIAKDLGVLTIAVVTKPFAFEGTRRMRSAEAGIVELEKVVDTLIVIPNQNLFRIADEKTTFAEAFILADQVLYSGVACIVDLVVKEGLINLDLADVKAVLTGMGAAVMGTGEAEGERRAVRAAEAAIENRLLDDVSLAGAKGLLLSIIGGRQLTLFEVDEAASRVRREVDPEANIIVGAAFDDSLGDRVRVSIVASGLERQPRRGVTPIPMADAKRDQAKAAPIQEPVAAAQPSEHDLGVAPSPRAQADVRAEPAGATPPTASRRPLPPPLPTDASAAADRSADPTVGLHPSRTGEPRVEVSEVRPTGPVFVQREAAARSDRVAPVYVPQAPADIPIRSATRMPDISDFPDVIQKAYAERQAPARNEPARPRPAVERPPEPVAPVDPRKGSLFRRLAEATGVRSRAVAAPDPVPDFLSDTPAPKRGRQG
jgi:cell division protein FtsZ